MTNAFASRSRSCFGNVRHVLEARDGSLPQVANDLTRAVRLLAGLVEEGAKSLFRHRRREVEKTLPRLVRRRGSAHVASQVTFGGMMKL